MSYYNDVYLKRLNRYGTDFQSRIQGQREREFDNYLEKSVYRINFTYGNESCIGSLEPYKQDYTETQAYLLTKIGLDIPNGAILQLPNKDGILRPWMIWWLESMKASGYNRYVVLRMSHEIQWIGADGLTHQQWMYFSGPGKSKIQDTIKSKTGETVYKENNNLYQLITTATSDIAKDDYFEVIESGVTTAYRVTDLDIISTQGVAYISVDPIYLHDHSEPPAKQPSDKDTDFYWLDQGGTSNGST